MATTTLKTINDIFREMYHYVGLNKFKIETYERFNFNEIVVNFSLTLSAMDQSLEGITKTLQTVCDDIKNSEASKDAKYTLTEENQVLNKRIIELKREVDRLKEFETYYNMTFKMEHGK